MEERKRKAEEKKRVKRMLEAGFDGDLDEINAILKEVILFLFFFDILYLFFIFHGWCFARPMYKVRITRIIL